VIVIWIWRRQSTQVTALAGIDRPQGRGRAA
jgi:hypothetical protein